MHCGAGMLRGGLLHAFAAVRGRVQRPSSAHDWLERGGHTLQHHMGCMQGAEVGATQSTPHHMWPCGRTGVIANPASGSGFDAGTWKRYTSCVKMPCTYCRARHAAMVFHLVRSSGHCTCSRLHCMAARRWHAALHAEQHYGAPAARARTSWLARLNALLRWASHCE